MEVDRTGRELDAVRDRGKLLRGDVLDVGATLPEPSHLARVHVHAEDLLAGLREGDGQREAYISQSDDPDAHPDTVPSVPPVNAASWRSDSARISAPSRRRTCHATVASSAVARSQRGRQPSSSRAREEFSRSTAASPAADPGGAARTGSPPGQRARTCSTTQPTGR